MRSWLEKSNKDSVILQIRCPMRRTPISASLVFPWSHLHYSLGTYRCLPASPRRFTSDQSLNERRPQQSAGVLETGLGHREVHAQGEGVSGEVAVMQVPGGALLSVRTRSRTLTLQRAQWPPDKREVGEAFGEYLDLRNRRLEKPHKEQSFVRQRAPCGRQRTPSWRWDIGDGEAPLMLHYNFFNVAIIDSRCWDKKQQHCCFSLLESLILKVKNSDILPQEI